MIFVHNNSLTFQNQTYACAIGKGGLSNTKKEGDGCTPIGSFSLRECWVRADRVTNLPPTGLPVRIITPHDAWCDDAKSELYNKHFTLGSTLCLTLPSEGGGDTASASIPTQMNLHGDGNTPSPSREEGWGGGISFECLHRTDHVYDIIIPLGYNDDPIIPGKGSAIFFHLATEDYAPTEGCVAVSLGDMLTLLPHLNSQTVMYILG